jgi:hypothetical protein
MALALSNPAPSPNISVAPYATYNIAVSRTRDLMTVHDHRTNGPNTPAGLRFLFSPLEQQPAHRCGLGDGPSSSDQTRLKSPRARGHAVYFAPRAAFFVRPARRSRHLVPTEANFRTTSRVRGDAETQSPTIVAGLRRSPHRCGFVSLRQRNVCRDLVTGVGVNL